MSTKLALFSSIIRSSDEAALRSDVTLNGKLLLEQAGELAISYAYLLASAVGVSPTTDITEEYVTAATTVRAFTTLLQTATVFKPPNMSFQKSAIAGRSLQRL
ncbi:hypothetical protein [Mesorhizobium sp. M0243]|uniref:hypothetical protein n=1 Tax=Mesorhizobium sp. M0243 TaxID=2956925 RepID=UPI003336C832